jgi:putative redox protein
MASHKIHSEYLSGLSFRNSIDNHQLITDTNVESGGNNDGPSPKKLMLVSLAGCTGIDVAMILHKMKVPFKDLHIDINACLTDTQPSTYSAVHIIYSVAVAEADQDKMNRAVQLSENKFCGVMTMFKSFAKVTHEVQFRPL